MWLTPVMVCVCLGEREKPDEEEKGETRVGAERKGEQES